MLKASNSKKVKKLILLFVTSPSLSQSRILRERKRKAARILAVLIESRGIRMNYAGREENTRRSTFIVILRRLKRSGLNDST